MKTRILYIICAAAGSLFLFAACEKEKERAEQAQEPGKPVVFRCETWYDNGTETKTAYSGIVTNDVERIDWEMNDEIIIQSNKAYGLTSDYSADPLQIYTITGVTQESETASKATIVPDYGCLGLHWLDEGEHEFYGLYPSTYMNSDVEVLSYRKYRLTLPAEQSYIAEYQADRTVLRPDMRYAYMGTAVRSGVASSVDLAFKPLFTAFLFTVDSGTDDTMTLTRFSLSSPSQPLCGTYTVELNPAENPKYTLPGKEPDNTAVSIEFEGGNGITLTKGRPIQFTVFLLPIFINDVLTASFTTAAGETKSIELRIANGNLLTFEAGKKYHIDNLLLPGAWSYQMQGLTEGGVEPSVIEFSDDMKSLIYGDTYDISVVSYKERAGVTKGEPWKAYAQDYNGDFVTPGDATWPDWLSLSKTSGSGSATGEQVTLSVAPNWPEGDEWGDPELFAYVSGESMVENLFAIDTEVGSESSPRDLSLYNIYGEPYSSKTSSVTSITKPGHHTANCYVVSAPGWYCFPLVYGNAFDTDSSPSGLNEAAYLSTSAEAYRNSKNQPITSPDILEDLGLTASTTLDAVVVWQDVVTGADIIREVPVIMDAPTASSLSCKYIRFHIAKQKILPGNIVIALRDKGNILWSWHIWVTETPHAQDTDDFKIRSLTYRTTQEENGPMQTLGILNCNLGWTPPIMFKNNIYIAERRTKIKIESLNGSREYEVVQKRDTPIDTELYTSHLYSGTYYQWGRKDPFLPSAGYNTVYNRVCTSRHYTIVSGQAGLNSKDLARKVSNWIQNPHVFDSPGNGYYRSDLWNADISSDARTYDADNALMNTAVRKTIYDPCPPGFCVPLGRAFTGFTRDGANTYNSNSIYGKMMWKGDGSHGHFWREGFDFSFDGTNNDANYTLNFQNMGGRSGSSNGDITGLNEYGYYWTSVSNGQTRGWILQIANTWDVRPVHYGNYGNGYSIRPVLER